jgi:hypothetical protein
MRKVELSIDSKIVFEAFPPKSNLGTYLRSTICFGESAAMIDRKSDGVMFFGTWGKKPGRYEIE